MIGTYRSTRLAALAAVLGSVMSSICSKAHGRESMQNQANPALSRLRTDLPCREPACWW